MSVSAEISYETFNRDQSPDTLRALLACRHELPKTINIWGTSPIADVCGRSHNTQLRQQVERSYWEDQEAGKRVTFVNGFYQKILKSAASLPNFETFVNEWMDNPHARWPMKAGSVMMHGLSWHNQALFECGFAYSVNHPPEAQVISHTAMIGWDKKQQLRPTTHDRLELLRMRRILAGLFENLAHEGPALVPVLDEWASSNDKLLQAWDLYHIYENTQKPPQHLKAWRDKCAIQSSLHTEAGLPAKPSKPKVM